MPRLLSARSWRSRRSSSLSAHTVGEGALSASGTVTIEVTDNGPVAPDGVYIIAHNQPLSGAVDPYDDAQDPLTYTSVGNPSAGTLDFDTDDGTFSYVPALDRLGMFSFTYTVSDGALFATGTVRIYVTDYAPLAYDDAFTTATVAAPGVLANDFDNDGDTLSACLVNQPSHGTVTLNANGSFVYVPYPQYSGADSFTYCDFDGALYSNVATVTLDVGLTAVPNFTEPGELIDTPSGAQGGNPMASAFSAGNVRYNDGAVEIAASELSSDGFGTPWGQDTAWTNAMLYSTGGVNGSGIVDAQMPHLLDINGDQSQLILVSGGTNARYFGRQPDGTYTESFFLLDTLSETDGSYVFTDPSGDTITFWGFASNIPAGQQGQLQSVADPYGNLTVANWGERPTDLGDPLRR